MCLGVYDHSRNNTVNIRQFFRLKKVNAVNILLPFCTIIMSYYQTHKHVESFMIIDIAL